PEPSVAGHDRALTVKADPGNFFNAQYPVATFTQWGGIVAFELMHKALAQVLDTIPASSGGDEPGFMALGNDPRTGQDFVISNNGGSGWGARQVRDGAHGQQRPTQSVARTTASEVLEHTATGCEERL